MKFYILEFLLLGLHLNHLLHLFLLFLLSAHLVPDQAGRLQLLGVLLLLQVLGLPLPPHLILHLVLEGLAERAPLVDHAPRVHWVVHLLLGKVVLLVALGFHTQRVVLTDVIAEVTKSIFLQ